ncbi:hypothetical protein ACP4OV_022792 [Aristida adscensionis]
MATAAAAVVSSAARRLSRTASTIVAREVTGHHHLTIDGFAASRKLPPSWSSASPPFEAAGYRWRITYHPNGNSWNEHVSLYLELDGDHPGGDRGGGGADRGHDPVRVRFSLLDQAGNPVPEYSCSKEVRFFSGNGETSSTSWGVNDFIRWKDLEASGCLKDDRFTVRCDITVLKDWVESGGAGEDGHGGDGAAAARVVVPPSDLHAHLNALLWKKQGADVVIGVGGGGGGADDKATFAAHGWLLAARSPVFEAELLAAAKETTAPFGGVPRRIEVHGVEPKVFKAMLHYMYTDALPETAAADEKDAAAGVAMALGLLAAAHRYKLERLKAMCEDTLCRRIDVGTVVGTLAAAEQHGCRALKAACMEFIARPGNLKAVMATEGFQKIKDKCPLVLMELVIEQLP